MAWPGLQLLLQWRLHHSSSGPPEIGIAPARGGAGHLEIISMEGYVLKFSSQSSALVKSFWAGKIIQTLTHSTSSSTTASGSSPSREHDDQPLVQQELVSAALDCLKRHETSLSARVFDTISQSECNESDEECLKFLDAEGTLNWEVVSQYLGRGGGRQVLIFAVFMLADLFCRYHLGED